jgi:tRNA(Ile2) C34 agmatinyltransferase TiaS
MSDMKQCGECGGELRCHCDTAYRCHQCGHLAFLSRQALADEAAARLQPVIDQLTREKQQQGETPNAPK